MQPTTSPAQVSIHLPDEVACVPLSQQSIPSSSKSPAVYIQDGIAADVSGHSVSSAPATGSSEHPADKMVPFVPSKLHRAASWALETADFYGEKLAFFFGITTPKYSYEINQYHKMAKEEESERLSAIDESGWNTTHTSSVSVSSGLGSSFIADDGSSLDNRRY